MSVQLTAVTAPFSAKLIKKNHKSWQSLSPLRQLTFNVRYKNNELT
jgi:hypothetical protein